MSRQPGCGLGRPDGFVSLLGLEVRDAIDLAAVVKFADAEHNHGQVGLWRHAVAAGRDHPRGIRRFNSDADFEVRRGEFP